MPFGGHKISHLQAFFLSKDNWILFSSACVAISVVDFSFFSIGTGQMPITCPTFYAILGGPKKNVKITVLLHIGTYIGEINTYLVEWNGSA